MPKRTKLFDPNDTFPKSAQTAAYKECGYLVASPGFETRREKFERWCELRATPLVIIWPFANRRTMVTMQLFNCTNSILDDEFQASFRDLARIWGASSHQAKHLPVSFADVTPSHARVLAGHLHRLAAETYQRRAAKVTHFRVVEGPPSDGKPKMSYGLGSCSCVFPVEGQRHYACTLLLANGERFQGGFIGTRVPEPEFMRQQFAKQNWTFQLQLAPKNSP
jgi:hypothetical protein